MTGCMTCNGANIADLIFSLTFYGTITLCRDHASLMAEASGGIVKPIIADPEPSGLGSES